MKHPVAAFSRFARCLLAGSFALLAFFALNTAHAQSPGAPLIQWLVATPASIPGGASTTLRWHVDGADSLSIDHGIGTVQAQGSLAISPSSTTTYTLTATNANGSVQKSHVVVVAPNAATSGGRFVKMVSPTGGQKFTAPATIRVFAAAFDPNGVNCGAGGFTDRCASRVDFYVDDTVMAQVPGSQSEYWVFKSSFSGVAAGTHRVWARAIYTNPPASLDSEPMWITVEAPPAYAQTLNLTSDVVLTGSQNYEFTGTPSGRIRLNGNGHRITSSGNWTGRLTLKYVDLFDLGVMNDPTPAIDVSTNNTVAIENSTFDTTGTVSLFLTGTAAASIRSNEFRSNMLMPEQQQPEFGSDSSYPAIALAGNSTAQKFFQGNTIGIGWADFRNADNWLIGSATGGSDADGNIVIAPRGGIWAQNMTRTAIRGNAIYHVYYGGWSQGNVMEIGSSNDIVIEHNVVGGGSWPIRSLGGTLRYNLVIDAGHQWLWVTGNNASVHHNIFAGGDADVGGIFVIGGPQNVDIYNNTIDGLGAQSVVPVWILENATASVRANAIVNSPNPPAVQVDSALDADYNLFSGQSGTTRNYSDNRAPAHDIGGLNGQTNPQFLESTEPWRYAWEDIWTRRISVNQILANYRVRYTPAPGSPLIDAGETVLVAGADIGAVGSGTPAIDDRFGLANIALPSDTTPPVGTVAINGGAATTDQTSVALTLSATDDATGVAEMRFSNDGVTFSSPIAFSGTAAWVLSNGNGLKTVRAQFRDGAGNWSNAFTDTITLNAVAPVDATPPTGTIQINGGAATTAQTAVTLALTATDNATGVVEMRFSNDGTTFSAPIPFATTAAWVLTSGDGTKTVRVQFRDGAGNLSTSFTDTIVLASGPPPSSLVAAYGFDEGTGTSAADASGNGLSGAISNAAWVAGKNGNALQFTGQSNSLVSVANSSLLQLTTAYTLEAWVNPQGSQPPEPTVIAKTIPGDLPYVLYTQGTGGVGPNAYALVNGSYQQASTPNLIPANTWTHVAATYNGTTLSVYVNGVLAGSSAVSGTMATGNGALQIGNNAVFSGEGFSGRIDDVRVYNRALSAAEIQTDMATPVGAPVTPPPDTTPPTGSVVINGGAASTDQTNVTLTLAATDNATGVTEMRFSNDGTSFSAPVPFATSATWALTSGAGLKTVHVQFRDGAGNLSGSFTDTITLTVAPPPDSTPPTGTVVVNGGAASTSQTTVTLTLAATDNATGVVEMRFSNDGSTFSTPVAFATTATWALTSGNGTKTVHAQFRDGAGNWSTATTDSIDLAAGPAQSSQLGAHVLLAQNEFAGTSPAVTPGINTQPSGSTLLALSMGWLRNLSPPVDTFGNQWTQLSGPNIYFSPDFYTAMWVVPTAVGGNNHKLSFNKTEYPEGEISMALIEVQHGGQVDMIYSLAPGSNQSPGSITVDGPATLIAVWGGDAFALDNTAVPDNGFTVIDSYLDFGNNNETAVQVAIAAKQVTAPGTYTVRWTSTPTQNCACYLIAVKNSAQVPPPPPPSGLVAAYGFEEGQGTSAADSSGNALSGAVTNAAWAAGKNGNALQFTGQSNSMVTVADSPLLQLSTAYTLSAWVNPEASQPSEPTVIAKTIPGDLPYVLYTQGTGGVGPNAYALVNGSYQQAASPSLIPADTWTHVAATYNGTTLSVYVNGVLANSNAVNGSMSAGNGPLQIGNNAAFADEGFIGRIDDVRVYNRALSAAEIQTDMATPVGASAPADTTPPTGAIIINANAASTTQAAVTLTLAATDDAGSVAQMRFSNDGTTFSTPVAFATAASWTLSAGDGPKTVHAQFRDAAGNWSTAVTDSITLASGLVAAYGFNEGQGTSTTDASGNALSGAVTNAAWVAGKNGNALQFTGQANSMVTVADSALLQLTTAYTLSAWVNPQAGQPSEPTVIAKTISGDLPYVLYTQGTGGVGPNAYVLAGGNYQQAASSSLIPANTWTHLAATYTGTTLSVYVNGVLANTTTVSGGLATGSGALQIGNNAVFPNEGFVGRIDDVRVYSRALSPAEIQSDMEAPIGGGGVIEPPPGDDVTPPSGTIVINGGAVSTDQTTVTLSLTATDNASGVVEMRFSNDGSNFSAPVAFASSASWVLTSGDGSKTVRAQFRDGAGNWSSSVADSISFSIPQPLPPISTAHPRILLVGAELARLQNDLATQRPSMKRFKEQMVDQQLAGADIYGYESWYSAMMGVVTGQPQYCAHAIQTTDAFLDEEVALIQANETPVARQDSYLFIGEVVGNIAMVYDWCYANLTPTQKLRWGNYADRFVDNLWNQETHHWGVPTAANDYSWDGAPKEPGTSWSVNNPVNNYYYSFLQATMLWGLASKHEPGRAMADGFLQKFRHEKIQNQLVPIFEAQLAGGGSREGTGYGTAMGNLFLIYHLWEKTTGERIADLTTHTVATMPYLMHAISPKRDFLAPIGDHARDSTAAFYDYHRKELAALAKVHSGTPMARSVRDFLAGSTVPQMGDRFNWVYDVLYDGVETVAPAQLNTAYFAPGTGHFFSRSSWSNNATWLTFLTGAFTESHAHADGLSLMLFKNGWLVNDANQSAHSGLANSQEAHGLVTQRIPGGAIIDMWGLEADPGASPPRPESSAKLKALATGPLYNYASSDQGTLFNHPNTGNPGVRSEREVVHIKPDIVVVFDRVDYAPGSTVKTFQLPIPGQPVITGRTASYSNGVSTLKVHAMQPTASTLSVTAMPSIDTDFEGGFRLDSQVTTSGLTHFLNVLSVDGAVVTTAQGSNAGTLTLTLADGRVVTLAFNLNGQGGTIEIRNSANEVLVSEALPVTVAVPATTIN